MALTQFSSCILQTILWLYFQFYSKTCKNVKPIALLSGSIVTYRPWSKRKIQTSFLLLGSGGTTAVGHCGQCWEKLFAAHLAFRHRPWLQTPQTPISSLSSVTQLPSKRLEIQFDFFFFWGVLFIYVEQHSHLRNGVSRRDCKCPHLLFAQRTWAVLPSIPWLQRKLGRFAAVRTCCDVYAGTLLCSCSYLVYFHF